MDLAQRISRLEQVARRQQAAALVLLGILAIATLTAAREPTKPEPAVRITDAATGRTLILGKDDESGHFGLVVRDPQGAKIEMAFWGGDTARREPPEVGLLAQTGPRRAALNLAVRPDGRAALSLGPSRGRPVVLTCDAPGNGGLRLYDANGTARAVLMVRPEIGGRLHFYNADGRLVLRQP